MDVCKESSTTEALDKEGNETPLKLHRGIEDLESGRTEERVRGRLGGLKYTTDRAACND
jgi:hypothetical protein